MPLTVSRNSPSTNVLPSTSRPSPTKNAVTVSRSATVMPTWSKRRACDMGSSSNYSFVDPLRGRGRRAGLDIDHEHFMTGRTLVDPRRAHAPQSPGSGQPTPRRHAARTATDEASHLHDVCPRTGALRLSAGYWFAGSIPVPAKHRERTRSARTGRCLCRRCCEKEAVPYNGPPRAGMPLCR
jgi:hypothetical protein